MHTPNTNWLCLAICGLLDGMIAATYFILQNAHGPLGIGAWGGTVLFLGEITLAAGACSMAAGLWRSAQGERWPLVVNGLALLALGVIYCFLTHYRISIRTIAMLIALMAISMAVIPRKRRERFGGWLPALAGALPVVCAVAFLMFAFRLIRLEPGSQADLLWLSLYFGFTAICMMGLARFPRRTQTL